MTARPKNTQTQSNRNDDIEARVSLLEYQVVDFKSTVVRALERIETKQDAATRQIDTLKYVDQHDFDAYVKDASKSFASASTVKWLLGLVGGIFIGSILAIIGVALR